MDLITTNLKEMSQRKEDRLFFFSSENFEFRMLHRRFKLKNVSNFNTITVQLFFFFFYFKARKTIACYELVIYALTIVC